MKKCTAFLCLCIAMLLPLWSPVFGETDLEHHWGPWTVVRKPTCIEEGLERRICDRFPDSIHGETRTIPKVDHSFVKTVREATCTAPGADILTCEYCGLVEETETDPPLGHDYGEWSIVKKATAKTTGLQQRICAHNPEHKQIQVIPLVTPAPQPQPKINTADIVIVGANFSLVGVYAVLILLDIPIILWGRRKLKSDFAAAAARKAGNDDIK